MSQPSAHEQYLLELINAERATVGAQPLAFHTDLNAAAEQHSQWMLRTDTFSHTGSGGSTPTQRMQAAGYSLEGSWTTGENIGWATTRAPAGYQDEVQILHENLMNSSGHRANILNPTFQEVGLGFEIGNFNGRESAFVTQNFAKSGDRLFLTGVAFDDQDGDGFYDPGEGLSGITITARSATGQIYETDAMTSGGYSLALPPGTYTVTFSGEGLASTTQEVTLTNKNIKLDLMDPADGTDEPAPAPAPDLHADAPPDSVADPTPDAQDDPDLDPDPIADPEDDETTTNLDTGTNEPGNQSTPGNQWWANLIGQFRRDDDSEGVRWGEAIRMPSSDDSFVNRFSASDTFHFKTTVATLTNAEDITAPGRKLDLAGLTDTVLARSNIADRFVASKRDDRDAEDTGSFGWNGSGGAEHAAATKIIAQLTGGLGLNADF